MTKRRNFSDKFKAAVTLEALRGDKTVQEIDAKRQLHPVNSDVKCNIAGGFDIRLLSHKKAMLPCQDIFTSRDRKGIRFPI
ncbi:MAG: hypothetical protein GY725_17070 [bacterium]|nr:hypothetical protein [bacterium]